MNKTKKLMTLLLAMTLVGGMAVLLCLAMIRIRYETVSSLHVSNRCGDGCVVAESGLGTGGG